MRVKLRTKVFLLFIIMFFIIGVHEVFAASISVGPSKSSVAPGESFTVSITSSGATGKVSISVSNGSVSPSSLWLEPSGSVTVTAGSAGTVGISVSAVDMSDEAGNEVSPSGYASVSVVAPNSSSESDNSSSNSGTQNSGGSSSSSNSGRSNTSSKPVEVKKSSDAKLKTLTIEGFDLYPEFDANTNEYNVKVTNDITSVNITAEANDSKANVKTEREFEELAVGENIVTILVTAEDGSSNRYIIKINREREALRLQSLQITYINETGDIVELTPIIEENIYEYMLENIPYYVSYLDLQVTSNLEEATIEILGNEELVEGENQITIKITMPAESEELEEEVLTYTFIVNKDEKPVVTFFGKIKNWFKGTKNSIGSWYYKNQFQIIMGALMLCSATLGGLSVYLIFAYKKYKDVLQKLAELTRMNAEGAKESITTETVLESLGREEIEDDKEEYIEEDKKEEKPKTKGRHF